MSYSQGDHFPELSSVVSFQALVQGLANRYGGNEYTPLCDFVKLFSLGWKEGTYLVTVESVCSRCFGDCGECVQ